MSRLIWEIRALLCEELCILAMRVCPKGYVPGVLR